MAEQHASGATKIMIILLVLTVTIFVATGLSFSVFTSSKQQQINAADHLSLSLRQNITYMLDNIAQLQKDLEASREVVHQRADGHQFAVSAADHQPKGLFLGKGIVFCFIKPLGKLMVGQLPACLIAAFVDAVHRLPCQTPNAHTMLQK